MDIMLSHYGKAKSKGPIYPNKENIYGKKKKNSS
jgi:hypothetical protein